MKHKGVATVILGASLSLILAGCGSKPDPNAELARAATALEEPAPPQTPAPAAQPTQPQQVQNVQAPVPATAPAQEMNQAIAAYKGGKLEDAVTRLQKLRATPALTPQQRIALNDAMAAVMTEIYGMAAKGDTRAIQAVKQYEAMQTSRR